MKPPPVHYAKGPEGRVAYQTLGDGPIDLVFVPFVGRHNLDVIWEHPSLERYLRRLATFSRLILFNFRGTGLSDPMRTAPIPEEMMLDIKLVLDTISSERAALFAVEFAGPVPAMFAATFPERTLAVIFLNGLARIYRDDDYPWGFPPKVFEGFGAALAGNWGTGRNLDFMAPELARDERFREWFARLERLSTSPGIVDGTGEASTIAQWDVRGILSSIRAPTLVIAHTDVRWIRLGHGRYLAEHIPNARYLEREGTWGGIYWVQDVEWTLEEIQTFLTGNRGAPDLDDRVLATVLFTDIVGSTERAAELGDEKWRILLDEHDTVVRREIERFRGRALNFTGDGFLATFDGPARAIRCAVALGEAVRSLGLELRTGLHTGEVEQREEHVGGIAVHIGARVMKEAGPGEVLVSGAVPPLVAGSGIEFEDRGEHALKGVPGEWRLYSVKA